MIRIGIFGYGNLGRGVECAVLQNPDMQLVGVFTRRSPDSVKTVKNTPVYHTDDALKMQNDIDVMIPRPYYDKLIKLASERDLGFDLYAPEINGEASDCPDECIVINGINYKNFVEKM